VLKKMDYFLDGSRLDAELVALAFGAFAEDQLVARLLDVVELEHQQLSLVLLVMMVLEYLMTLAIENQVANQPKLLQQFQL
jgi:hypothetical protein